MIYQTQFWAKLIISIVFGVILGSIGINNGMFGNCMYLVVIGVGFQYFVASYLQIDTELIIGNSSAVITEGLLPSYAGFLLMWILAYNIRLSLY